MRHRKDTFKIGHNSSHRRALLANMLKSLIIHERIETTVAKAKELRRYADRMVSLAKQGTLASRRSAIAKLMIRFNQLTSKEQRQVKEGNLKAYNDDRLVLAKLFDELGPRFSSRAGGYTRMVRTGRRQGDNGETCLLEYLDD